MLDANSQIIMNMHQGEKSRDASSKVCGFLFQDLIALDKLLNEQTEYVCSEYVEDVFVSSKDTGAVYIIQAKYRPQSTVTLSAVMRDLYYQYLRLQLYGYTGKVIPVLAMHCKCQLSKPTLAEMQGKDYINVCRTKKPLFPPKGSNWLEKNVYQLKKDDAENTCFNKFAWNDSIENFLSALEIQNDYKVLKQYRRDIALKLDKINFSGCPITDDSMRQNVLLGLAIQYIQETYSEPPVGMDIFSFRKRSHDEFVQYLSNQICTETEENIGAYLRTVAFDCWDTVEKFNKQLTQEQIDMLQCICDNTADWLFHLGSTPQGQLQLLNTVSMRDRDSLFDFSKWCIVKRRQIICEHHDAVNTFLCYLWKILFDINSNLIGKTITNEEMTKLRPETYFDTREKRYLKVAFPGEMASSAVILSAPNCAHSDQDLTCTFERMEPLRPEKWYMCGKYHGKFSYDQNVAEISNNRSVSEIHTNKFRIECMDCIKVDTNCWWQLEACNSTIFLDNCINFKEEE